MRVTSSRLGAYFRSAAARSWLTRRWPQRACTEYGMYKGVLPTSVHTDSASGLHAWASARGTIARGPVVPVMRATMRATSASGRQLSDSRYFLPAGARSAAAMAPATTSRTSTQSPPRHSEHDAAKMRRTIVKRPHHSRRRNHHGVQPLLNRLMYRLLAKRLGPVVQGVSDSAQVESPHREQRSCLDQPSREWN